jgi:hypothetical protein
LARSIYAGSANCLQFPPGGKAKQVNGHKRTIAAAFLLAHKSQRLRKERIGPDPQCEVTIM